MGNFLTATRAAVAVAFTLEDFTVLCTFVRPVGFNASNGLTAGVEIMVSTKALTGTFISSLDLGDTRLEPGDERLCVLGADLLAISKPTKGDYLIMDDGTRLDVLLSTYNRFADTWLFHARALGNEDHGPLDLETFTDDWGDLAASDSFDDRLTLT